MTAELVREVENSRWHQFVGGMLGLLIGLLFVLPVNLAFDPTDERSLTRSMAVLVVPFVLIFVGRGISGLVFALEKVSGSIRVAKSWAPRLTDYVSRIGLVVMRVEMVVVLTAGLAATQSPSLTGASFEPGQSVYVWGSIVVVALMWAGVELVAHRLVGQPQPSADAATLFWCDALRGEVLRDVCRQLPWLGVLVPQVISQSLPRFYGTPAAWTGPGVVFASSTVILLLAFGASMLLIRSPTSRRNDALLVAARRSWQGA